MPDTSYLSLTGAKTEAESAQTRLALSVLHLFNAGFTPSPTTPLAEFLANECDFDGYAAKTITAWANPVLAGAAFATYAPTQTFDWTAGAELLGSQVGGSFLVLASGVLYQYSVFDPTRSVMGPDQALITTPTIVYPAG